MLEKKPKKISIHHALRPACKAAYWSIKANFKIHVYTITAHNYFMEAVSVKKGSKIRKVIASAHSY